MSVELSTYNAEQAKEIGLPSPEAIQYMMAISDMLITSALITPDMEPSKEAIGALVAAKWTQPEIDLYRDKVIKANAMAKMLVGREMGMAAMEALQDIDIVKGKIFVRYPQLIGQLMRKGYSIRWIERSNVRAALEVTRPGLDPEVFEYTIEDARMAGSLGGKPEYNQYILRPRIMLTARVASETYRATGGRSNVYTPEEKAEIINVTSTTDDPSESDKARADVLAAQEEKYRVAVKPDKSKDVTPEPEQKSGTVQETKSATEQPKPVQFEIHILMDTPGGKPKPVLLPNETQTTREAATLRAQALANETGNIHVVVKFDPNNNERVEADRCKPPVKAQTDPASAAPVSAATAAAPATTETATDKPKTAAPVGDATVRLQTVAKNLGIPEKTALTRSVAYMAGWIGCSIKDFKSQSVEEKQAALDSLEFTIEADVNEFNAGPEESGKRRRKWYDEMLTYLTEKWTKPEHVPTIKLAINLYQQWGQQPSHFKKWFEMEGVALDFVSMEDVHAVLRVLLRTRDGVDLLKMAKVHNLSVQKIVAQMEERILNRSIEDATVQAVENAIKEFGRAVKEEAKPKVALPTEIPAQVTLPVEPPVEDEPTDEGLFGSSW